MPDSPARRECPAYETTHDFSAPGGLLVTVVEALAAARGVSPTDIDPLYDAVDPDALERLVGRAADNDAALSAAFDAGAWNVTVHSDGRVLVRECDRAPEPPTPGR